MKLKGIMVGAALVAAFVFVLGSAAASGGTAQKGRRGRAALVAKGKRLYALNCARCHGQDGRGQTSLGQMVEAPDMTDPSWRRARSESRMKDSVLKGRAAMPAFDGQLTRAEIAAVVAYVRAFRK